MYNPDNMKIRKPLFRILILSIALIWIAYPFAEASQDKTEYRKIIEKEFEAPLGGAFQLAAKYGEVKIMTWSEPRIEIETIITVDACNEEDANRTFERIRIEFEQAQDIVRARTVIDDESFSFKSLFRRCQVSFTIDYQVHIPATHTLNLKNKYGNTIVAELDGDASIDVEYGDLRIDRVGGALTLNLAYGNGTAGKAGSKLAATISYGKFRAIESGDVTVVSKYSTFGIDHCNLLTSSSKYDHIEARTVKKFSNTSKYSHIRLDSAGAVTLQAEYTDVRIDNVAESLVAAMRYGGLEVSSLSHDFRVVTLSGKYTGFEIRVARDVSFQVEATASNGGLSFPASLIVTHQLEDNGQKSVKGYQKGTHSEVERVIRADIEYGSFELKSL